MTTISLLRHGETCGGNIYRGSTDQPLTQTGWQQMRNAVDSEHKWQKIVSSPLLRCSEFASYLSKQLTIPFVTDERLKEMNFGDWEGLSAEKIYQQTPDNLTRFWEKPLEYTPPNGEHILSLQSRVLEAWSEIVNNGGKTLIVTHGGPIRTILCHMNNIPIEKALTINAPLASLHHIAITEKCIG